MSNPTTLNEAACLNARKLLAGVIRSFRRSGDFLGAQTIIRNARLLGTYPALPGSRLSTAGRRRAA